MHSHYFFQILLNRRPEKDLMYIVVHVNDIYLLIHGVTVSLIGCSCVDPHNLLPSISSASSGHFSA